MNIKEPKYRSGSNLKQLATLFKYKIEDQDQDWTYTIAESKRITEYIEAYDTSIKDENTKFSLMEMIIQALEGLEQEKLIKQKWVTIEKLMNKDFELHQYTIFYWCVWDNEDLKDCWNVTPFFRKLWLSKQNS